VFLDAILAVIGEVLATLLQSNIINIYEEKNLLFGQYLCCDRLFILNCDL